MALAWGYRGCSKIASGSEQPTLPPPRQWRFREGFLAVGIWGSLDQWMGIGEPGKRKGWAANQPSLGGAPSPVDQGQPSGETTCSCRGARWELVPGSELALALQRLTSGLQSLVLSSLPWQCWRLAACGPYPVAELDSLLSLNCWVFHHRPLSCVCAFCSAPSESKMRTRLPGRGGDVAG